MTDQTPGLTIGEAKQAFLECPENYFFHHDQTIYDWAPDPYSSGENYLKDIYVIYADFAMAWVQSISVKGRIATIGHIALEPILSGSGLGIPLAHAVARRLSAVYDVDTIHFAERNTAGKEVAYQKFFSRLGAERSATSIGWEWRFTVDDIRFQ